MFYQEPTTTYNNQEYTDSHHSAYSDDQNSQYFFDPSQTQLHYPVEPTPTSIHYSDYYNFTTFHPNLRNTAVSTLSFDSHHELLHCGGMQTTGTPKYQNEKKKETTYTSMMCSVVLPSLDIYSSVSAHPACDASFTAPNNPEDPTKFKVKVKEGLTEIHSFLHGTATLSLYGIRCHNKGGLLLADHPLKGVQTGCFNPGSPDPTHLTVGGSSIPGQQLHCLDIYNAFSPVSTLDLNANVSVLTSSPANSSPTILAGCTDGSIRVLDGLLRSFKRKHEYKFQAHSGGVSR